MKYIMLMLLLLFLAGCSNLHNQTSEKNKDNVVISGNIQGLNWKTNDSNKFSTGNNVDKNSLSVEESSTWEVISEEAKEALDLINDLLK